MKTRRIFLLFFLVPASWAAQNNKARVVEEIIARVNNEIIALSDYERAKASVEEEVRLECRGCTPAQLQAAVAEKQKNLLRDLIDQSLLAQRGKDLGISVETEVVKRLDQIRQQNNLPSMEALQSAVEGQGISFEDFKSQIRNGLLTQEVIRREVGSKIMNLMGHDEVQKYYEEHKNDFYRPEQVYLREIFVSTDGKKPEEIPELDKKAQTLLERVKKGEDFGELAKRYSDGNTGKMGGDLGFFQRGQLSKDLEDIVFKMNRTQVSDVIHTKTGFLILQVMQRYEAGLQPLDKVENEIMNRLYMQKMEPALRKYLGQLREDSYVLVKPGYVDTAGVTSQPIEEVQAGAEEGKSKKSKRKKSSE